MSRLYGSLPLMGRWPQLSSSTGGIIDPALIEAQMKALEFVQVPGGPTSAENQMAMAAAAAAAVATTSHPMFGVLSGQPAVNSASHLTDPNFQASMMARLYYLLFTM